MKRKILLTGIGGDVACAITRCLMKGFPKDQLYGYDVKRLTPYMEYFYETEVAPPYTDVEYKTFVSSYIKRHGITHFIPTTEPEILIADEMRQFYSGMGVKLLINDHMIIRNCCSKYCTAKLLQEIGVGSPETYYAGEYRGELGYPFILKPDRGNGSKQVLMIRNEDEWQRAEKQGMVCQSLVGSKDDEYTVGLFSDGNIVNSIIYRRVLGLGGMSVRVECVDIPDIYKLANIIAKRLDLKGCLNIQMRKENGMYFVFEINPRLSSTTGFRHLMGFEDVIWWVDMMDGKRIPRYENKNVGMVGLKVTDDMVISCPNKGEGYNACKLINEGSVIQVEVCAA